MNSRAVGLLLHPRVHGTREKFKVVLAHFVGENVLKFGLLCRY